MRLICISYGILIFRGFGSRDRDLHSDPSVERLGKWSPGDEQYYSTSPFWKTRWEMSPMHTIACRNTNAVSCLVNATRPLEYDFSSIQKMHARDKKITVPHLPKFLARTAPLPASLLPSPTSYTLPNLLGSGKKVSIQNRHLDSIIFRKSVAQPGPAEYSVRLDLGRHRPRYSLGGRFSLPASPCKHPGPASYDIKNLFDRYNISPPDYVPIFMRTKHG